MLVSFFTSRFPICGFGDVIGDLTIRCGPWRAGDKDAAAVADEFETVGVIMAAPTLIGVLVG